MASVKLELVDKFCYLGDMLSVDRDADAAVEARIRIGWNKFKQLVPQLTNKAVKWLLLPLVKIIKAALKYVLTGQEYMCYLPCKFM